MALLPALFRTMRSTRPELTRTHHQPPVVDGAMEASDRLMGALVGVGSQALVENPCYPWLLDLLDVAGTVPVPVALDAAGLVPAPPAQGLHRDPAVLLVQPRAQNPTGATITAGRAEVLAQLLRGIRIVIVEDDHCGDVAEHPVVGLGAHLPEQTAHIHGVSKSYGPDLRLAAFGGAGSVVHEVVNRRALGPGWSGRLLQGVLVDLLQDQATQERVAEARHSHEARMVAPGAAPADGAAVAGARGHTRQQRLDD